MSRSRPVVVDRPEETQAAAMSDEERRDHFQRTGNWGDWIPNDAGDTSGWHDHAANVTYVYVSRGSIRFEFGQGGAESVVARAGDFVIVPAHTIHRKITGDDSDLEAFVIRVGGEPEEVAADGPETLPRVTPESPGG
jgi:uncharacterized RmlC-like cupin family protein